MGTTLAAAQQLEAQLTAALTAAGSKARASCDPETALQAALSHGGLLIGPPQNTYGATYGSDLATFTVTAATTDAGGYLKAWARLDELLDVVASTLDVASCTPGQLSAPTGGDPLPAFVITLEPLDL